MKRVIAVIAFCVLLFPLVCQEEGGAEVSVADMMSPETEQINPKTGFPEIQQKPFVVFNEGFAFANVTRIETQSSRSNFVWQNSMMGLFFEVQSKNMRPLNSVIRVSAFYPFSHTFNDIKQVPKQTILYAFDLFAGPIIETDMWKYVRLKFSAGLHYMYQLTDEYHLHYLGVGLLTGLELPVAPRWTVLLDGTFALDYPNFGTNRLVQPFDYAWQYHLNFGLRYSRKSRNQYSYIRQSEKSRQREIEQLRLREEKKAQKAQERAERKAAKEAARAEAAAQNETVAAEEEGFSEEANEEFLSEEPMAIFR